MNRLLASWAFRYKAGYAFNQTTITNLEHGFFIWLLPSGEFLLSKVYTGSYGGMGGEYALASIGFSGFATLHTHTGDWNAAMGPSGFYEGGGGDLFFDYSHNSIGILINRKGQIIYGH
jgi:hypothetical protein